MELGFKSFELLEHSNLGRGAYGSVCKAMCDDLLCAAKILYPILFDQDTHQQIEPERRSKLPVSRFMQECEFMRTIRHPNIVQCLGTCEHPQSGMPILLMELMDHSLTHFLESSLNDVPYHIQVNFCHDITLAISYLHSNKITHRDLSGNNVLLCGNVKAKVSDLGMARLNDIYLNAGRCSLTLNPGTDAYMPPEAVKDPPNYTEKIDCFSIGALIIQILSRNFPEPRDRLKTIEIDHPKFPGGTVDVRISEIERRQNHISQVNPDHPLLPIALECLDDSDEKRPSARELCHRIGALKETPQFTESARRAQQIPEISIMTEKQEQIEQLEKTVQEKDEEIHQLREENAAYVQVIESQKTTIEEKEQTIAAFQRECQLLRDNIKAQDSLIRQQFEQTAASAQSPEQSSPKRSPHRKLILGRLAKSQPKIVDPPLTPTSNPSIPTTPSAVAKGNFALKWRVAKAAPCKMARPPDVHVDGDTVYLKAGDTLSVYAYHSTDEAWNQLPDCEFNKCCLTVVKSLLTTIGGRSSAGNASNQLFSLTGKGKKKKWKEVFKPMPTKRSLSVSVCTEQALVVIGGRAEGRSKLRTVEVMEIDTQHWSSAAELPEPLSSASITICDDSLYIVGGSNDSGPTQSVYTCTLTDLFLSCHSKPLGERLARSQSPTRCTAIIWEKIADLPIIGSTCVTLHGRLLAIGGSDGNHVPTSDVHVYDPTCNKWEVISEMISSRRWCLAAVLPNNNQIMVLGGYSGIHIHSATDKIQIATVSELLHKYNENYVVL